MCLFAYRIVPFMVLSESIRRVDGGVLGRWLEPTVYPIRAFAAGVAVALKDVP